MYQLAKKYRITFDSAAGNCFIVHKGEHEKVIFKPSKEGLYYHNMMGSKEVTMTHVQGRADDKTVYFKKDKPNLFSMTTAHLEHP